MGIDEDLNQWDRRGTQFKRAYKNGDYIKISYKRNYYGKSVILGRVIQVFYNPPRVYYKSEKDGRIGFIVPSSDYSNGYQELLRQKQESRDNHKNFMKDCLHDKAEKLLHSKKDDSKKKADYDYGGSGRGDDDDTVATSVVDYIFQREKLYSSRASKFKNYKSRIEPEVYENPHPNRKYERIFTDTEYTVRLISEDEFESLSQLMADARLMRQLQRQEVVDREFEDQQKRDNLKKGVGFVIDDSMVKSELYNYLESKNIKEDQLYKYDYDNYKYYRLKGKNKNNNKNKNNTKNNNNQNNNNISNNNVNININNNTVNNEMELNGYDHDDNDDDYDDNYYEFGGKQDSDDDDDGMSDKVYMSNSQDDIYSDYYYNSNSSVSSPELYYYQGSPIYYQPDESIQDEDDYDEEEFAHILTPKEMDDWEEMKNKCNYDSNEELKEEHLRLLGLFESGYIPKHEYIIRRNASCMQQQFTL